MNSVSVIKVINFLLWITVVGAYAGPSSKEPSLNDQMMVDHFMGNLQSMVVLDRMPPDLQKNVAQFNYGLLFQFWLIPNYRTTFLKKDIGTAIYPKALRLIDLSDPLLLKPYYAHGVLAGDGLAKAHWLMLNQADQIFAQEKDYDRMVAAFRKWLTTTKYSRVRGT